MKMKNLIVASLCALAVTLFAVPIRAQTNSPQNIISQAWSWSQNLNTNIYSQDTQVWTGPVNNTVDTVNEIGYSCDLWRGSGNQPVEVVNTNSLTGLVINNASGGLFAGIEGRTREGAALGTFTSQNIGGNFGWAAYDFKVGLYLDGVYRFNETVLADNHSKWALEVGVQASKAMTQSAGLTSFIAFQTGNKHPLIGADINFSFGSGTGLLGLFHSATVTTTASKSIDPTDGFAYLN